MPRPRLGLRVQEVVDDAHAHERLAKAHRVREERPARGAVQETDEPEDRVLLEPLEREAHLLQRRRAVRAVARGERPDHQLVRRVVLADQGRRPQDGEQLVGVVDGLLVLPVALEPASDLRDHGVVLAPAHELPVERQTGVGEVGAADAHRAGEDVGLGVEEPLPGPELDDRFAALAMPFEERDEGGDVLGFVAGRETGRLRLIRQCLPDQVGDAPLLGAGLQVRQLVVLADEQAELPHLLQCLARGTPRGRPEVAGGDPQPKRVAGDLRRQPLPDRDLRVVRI